MVIALMLVVIAGLATAYVAMTVSGAKTANATISANDAYDLAATGLENGSYQLSLGSCSASWSAMVTITGQGEYQYSCVQNVATTTTTGVLTTTATTIPVASVANLASFGAVQIDSEVIFYQGISGSTLQNARRGQYGTTAATHILGAMVSQSQYIITSQAGSPALSNGSGVVTLKQAVFSVPNINYFAAGMDEDEENGIILRFNGSWSTALTGPESFTFQGIFTTPTYGQAVGYTTDDEAFIYQYNGSSWSLLTGSISNTRFSTVGCDIPGSPTNCWIGGQRRSPSRGLLYHAGTLFTDTGSSPNYLMGGVSCYGGHCVAVGRNHTYIFSSTSTAPFSVGINLSNTLNDVDCPQANRCVAVRDDGTIYYFNGSSWSSVRPTTRSLNGVHCPSSGNCVVVGNTGTIFNCTLPITSVSSCTAQTAPGTMSLNDVFCHSTTDCLAVARGESSVVYRYLGGTWSSVSLPASYTLNAVSGGTSTGSTVTPTVWLNQ